MRFQKYVAAGNDFIVFKAEDLGGIDYRDLSSKVCHRKFGIGADGILVAEESSFADIKMVYYNSDGSQGEMCGNGIRTFSKFLYDNDIVRKDNMSIETLAGVKHINLRLEDGDIRLIEVNMGSPIFEGEQIPVRLEDGQEGPVLDREILVDGRTYKFSAVRVGVPHVVIFLDSVRQDLIDRVGYEIERHPLFPQKTNVNFVEIVDRNYIKNYTWERGAGRTLGCGTGSCSAVVVGHRLGLLDEIVDVKTEGGILQVNLEGEEIIMKGKSSLIAEGEYIYE